MELRARGAKIGLGTPVLGEIIAGIEGSQSREKSWKEVRPWLSKLILWSFDDAAAHEYGHLHAVLKRIGRPMQQIDIQIAAIATTIGDCTIVSYDSDLAAVPGLKVESGRIQNCKSKLRVSEFPPQ
ncbi:MAG TPA: type II toxin-antitoxin system VapC family toxin [Urbifossiella sp.]